MGWFSGLFAAKLGGWPEPNLQDPCGKRKELISTSCPLTFTCVHVYTYAHTKHTNACMCACAYSHTGTKDKIYYFSKPHIKYLITTVNSSPPSHWRSNTQTACITKDSGKDWCSAIRSQAWKTQRLGVHQAETMSLILCETEMVE